MRVLNLPACSRLPPAGFAPVAAKLAEICSGLDHDFWPCAAGDAPGARS